MTLRSEWTAAGTIYLNSWFSTATKASSRWALRSSSAPSSSGRMPKNCPRTMPLNTISTSSRTTRSRASSGSSPSTTPRCSSKENSPIKSRLASRTTKLLCPSGLENAPPRTCSASSMKHLPISTASSPSPSTVIIVDLYTNSRKDQRVFSTLWSLLMRSSSRRATRVSCSPHLTQLVISRHSFFTRWTMSSSRLLLRDWHLSLPASLRSRSFSLPGTTEDANDSRIQLISGLFSQSSSILPQKSSRSLFSTDTRSTVAVRSSSLLSLFWLTIALLSLSLLWIFLVISFWVAASGCSSLVISCPNSGLVSAMSQLLLQRLSRLGRKEGSLVLQLCLFIEGNMEWNKYNQSNLQFLKLNSFLLALLFSRKEMSISSLSRSPSRLVLGRRVSSRFSQFYLLLPLLWQSQLDELGTYFFRFY